MIKGIKFCPFSKLLSGKLITSHKNIFLFSMQNEKKKNSNWIYSSKYDEMKSMPKGKIFVTTDTGNDCHDVTLRMYSALMKESSVVFSHDPNQTKMLLKALSSKSRFIDPSLHQDKQKIPKIQQIIPRDDQQSALIKTELAKEQQKSFQQSIELGKYVDMQVDMDSVMKKQNDPGNKDLFERQKELKKYLKNREFRTQLQSLKQQQGYPEVLPILQLKEDIKYFYENGMNVTYVLHELQIQKSNKILKSLEQMQVPYEILPCRNQLINAIVASGFPADRFSIEYFPEDLQEILLRRKKAKLTIAMVVKRQNLSKVVETVSLVYSKDHLVFMENSPKPFRAQIHSFYDYLRENPLPEKESNIKIIIAPFIAEFNQVLLQQQNKIRHIYGQAQSQRTNFIDLQILGQKLHKLKKKQATHQIDVFNMAAEMIQKLKNPQIVKLALKKMLSLSQKQVEMLYNEGEKRIKIDYLGITEFQNFKKTK